MPACNHRRAFRSRPSAVRAYEAEPLERRRLLATVTWDGGGDGLRWLDPANWEGDALPTAADDVVISAPGAVTVWFVPPDRYEPFRVRSVTCAERLLVSGTLQLETTSVLQAGGSARLQNGILVGGAWDVTAGDFSCDDGTDNRLVGVDVVGEIKLNGGSRARLRIEQGSTFTHVRMQATEFNSLGFWPGQTLHGMVTFESGQCGIGMDAPGALTIAADAVIRKGPLGTGSVGRSNVATSAMALENHGLIEVDTSYLDVNAQSWTNHGVMRATNLGELRLEGNWVNAGTLHVEGDASIVLGGSFTTPSVAPGLVRAGGYVRLTGALDNTGHTLTFDQATGSWGGSGSVTGGDVVFADGARVTAVTLRDVQVHGTLAANYTLQGTTRFTEARLGGELQLGHEYVLRDPVTIDSPGTLRLLGTATIAPDVTVSITSPSDGRIISNHLTALVLTNLGTIDVDPGDPAWAAYVHCGLENRGVVRVRSGRLVLNGRPFSNQGMLDVAAPASVSFEVAPAEHGPGSHIVGDGEVRFANSTHAFAEQLQQFHGTLRTNGSSSNSNLVLTFQRPISAARLIVGYGVVEFASPQAFDFPVSVEGGTVRGAAALEFAARLDWEWGVLDGPGARSIPAGATLDLVGAGTRTLRTTLVNFGTADAISATVLLEGAGRIENRAGAVFTAGDASFGATPDVGRAFDNRGTLNLNRSGGWVRFNGVELNNGGAVNYVAGNLNLGGGGTTTVPLHVPAGHVIELTRGYSYSGAGGITGPGFVQFAGGTHSFAAGALAATGAVSVSNNAVVNLSAGPGANAFAPTSLLLVNNGTANIDADLTLGHLTISDGGALGGAGTVTVTTRLEWNSGRMRGAGTTVLAQGATAQVALAGAMGLARVFENRTNLTIGGGPITFGDAANVGVIRNAAGATLGLSGAGMELVAHAPGAHRIENDGTLRRASTNGAATLTGVALLNRGVVDAANGTMVFNGGGTQSAGASVLIPAGRAVGFGGTWVHDGDTSIAGAGTVRFNGGAHDVAASLNAGLLDVTGGARVRIASSGQQLVWRAGALSVAAGAALDMADNALVVDYAPGSPSPLGTPAVPGSVFALLATGYADGAWTGPGVNSAVAAAGPDGAIGFAEASSIFQTFPAQFLGETVDDTAVLVRFTHYGDATLDGLVNLQDFNRLAANFGASPRTFGQGDFTYDATVDLLDFNRLAARFGTAVAPTGAPIDGTSSVASDDDPADRMEVLA